MDKTDVIVIGSRLRAFREKRQIPRSGFAVKIGFGSERIASYESGRAPLPETDIRARPRLKSKSVDVTEEKLVLTVNEAREIYLNKVKSLKI